ncbi:MAG: hypothetical protein VW268_10645 [Rhodospirillaceae bacterium]
MAYAHYPTFFAELWWGLKPLCESKPFVASFQDNRAFVEAEVARLQPAPISNTPQNLGYGPREVDGIRQVVEIFPTAINRMW